MASDRVCSIQDCGKPVRARGWCVNHYALWERNGSPVKKPAKSPLCEIDGCGKKRKSARYCSMHQWRVLHHGSPHTLAPAKPPAPTKCGVEGCVSPPNGKRGMCNAHYIRDYRYGDVHHKTRADHGEPSRWLREHVAFDGDDCLIWPFATGRDGRGRLQNDISPQAHRAMCILVCGDPPSPDHEAAHSCGRGHDACVNPKHLRWATPVENAADRLIHGTEVRGEDCPQTKLTERDVHKIRSLYGSASHSEIGLMFGVSGGTIGDIFNRRTWAWLAAE